MIVTIAAVALFIWALAKEGGVGPLWKDPEEIYGVGKLTGSQLSWIMMRMVNSGIGGWAGGILYQSGMLTYVPTTAKARLILLTRFLSLCCAPRGPDMGPGLHHTHLLVWLQHTRDHHNVLCSWVLPRRAAPMVGTFYRLRRRTLLIVH